MTPDDQTLPQKEQVHFQRLIRYYDSKLYNPALSEARRILNKFPNHGETISMKALISNAQGKIEEADKLANEGLKNNFKSATCWHVVGILASKNKNYEKALKAYKKALECDNHNYVVLRDLSGMQHVLRKYHGYRETRVTIIPLKHCQNMSWIGFAIANYFLQDYNAAIKIVETLFESKKTDKDASLKYEVSEMCLMVVKMLLLLEKHQDALNFMTKNDNKIIDTLTKMETLGELYLKFENYTMAEKAYTWLIGRNPEKPEYYAAFEKLIQPQNIDEKLYLYDQIIKKYPRALTGKRIVLNFLPGDHELFESRLFDYIQTGIIKGRPALYQDLKNLYKDKIKAKHLESLINKIFVNLNNDEKTSTNPACYPWCCYFLTKHYTKVKNYELALDFVNKGINHTPTLVELYVVKAKVFKNMLNLKLAVDTIKEAESLDTADRFINCTTCKYLLENNEINQAQDMLNKFVKEEQDINDYLRELQVLWFEVLAIKTSFKTKNYGEALKRCHLVSRIFNDMFEDQFDFVQYCLRRATMSAFVDFIHYQDILNTCKFYQIAAFYASEIYFKIYDDKTVAEEAIKKYNESISPVKNDDNLNEKKDAESLKVEKPNDEDGWGPKKEPPLDPIALLKDKDPLNAIEKFSEKLQKFAPNSILTHSISINLLNRKSSKSSSKNTLNTFDAKIMRSIYSGLGSLARTNGVLNFDKDKNGGIDKLMDEEISKNLLLGSKTFIEKFERESGLHDTELDEKLTKNRQILENLYKNLAIDKRYEAASRNNFDILEFADKVERELTI